MTRSKWFAYLCVALLAATACSSSKKLDLGGTCSVNSDCNDPMSCAFGTCHQQCAEIRDCPQGDRCVFVNGVGVCQLPAEASCSGTGTCDPSLLCAGDKICRTSCTAAGTCSLASQTCVNGTYCMDPNESSVLNGDGGVKGDGSALGSDGPVVAIDGATLGKDGPSAGVDAGGGADVPIMGGGSDAGGVGGASGGTGGVGGSGGAISVCPKTQFGFTAEGDKNQYFLSGVGLRTEKQLLIFSGYTGPDPMASSDAGTPPTADYIYVQAFDPVKATKLDDAKPLFKVRTPASSGLYITAAAISPTGQIALLYYPSGGAATFAAFLDAAVGDGGVASAGVQFNRQVQLEASTPQFFSLPQAIWSVTYGAFVFSYQTDAVTNPIKVRKFYSDGRSLGGDSDGVPTTRPDNSVKSQSWGVATNRNPYLGVFYLDVASSAPFLTVLDAQGNQIGQTFATQQATTTWVTAGGTSTGYVAFYDQAGVGASFVPVASDGTITAPNNVDAGALEGFHFSGTKAAANGLALNDDAGGAGGVGLALLYSDSVSFAYVNPDRTHVGPAVVIPHTYNNSGYYGYDYISISNYSGSFAVSLWSCGEHMTRVAASNCQ